MQRATDIRDYTVRELAKKWRVSPAAVRKLIRDGQLPAYEPIPGSRSGLNNNEPMGQAAGGDPVTARLRNVRRRLSREAVSRESFLCFWPKDEN
ncbi:MAG: hypothetical protein KatS3mg105_3326 [Gemmatales bacterium]|nr:MAG: hypothetical protein KatS3mg105_3326 [Gemmatales bacterium]